jgi:hypothetical protein
MRRHGPHVLGAAVGDVTEAHHGLHGRVVQFLEHLDGLHHVQGLVLGGGYLEDEGVEIDVFHGDSVLHGARHHLRGYASTLLRVCRKASLPDGEGDDLRVIFACELKDGEPLGVVGSGIDEGSAPFVVVDLETGLQGGVVGGVETHGEVYRLLDGGHHPLHQLLATVLGRADVGVYHSRTILLLSLRYLLDGPLVAAHHGFPNPFRNDAELFSDDKHPLDSLLFSDFPCPAGRELIPGKLIKYHVISHYLKKEFLILL